MKGITLAVALVFSVNVLADSVTINLKAKHFANEVLSSNKLTNAQKLDLLLDKKGAAIYINCFLMQQASSGPIGDNDIIVSDCAKQ